MQNENSVLSIFPSAISLDFYCKLVGTIEIYDVMNAVKINYEQNFRLFLFRK